MGAVSETHLILLTFLAQDSCRMEPWHGAMAPLQIQAAIVGVEKNLPIPCASSFKYVAMSLVRFASKSRAQPMLMRIAAAVGS